MFDCSKDVLAFHDEKVTLPQDERTNMRERRDANRDRLKAGLTKNEKPKPKRFVKQGSYAMLTMVQDDGFDYDIDDGVYFKRSDLVGPRGGDMLPQDARQMVCDALQNETFKDPPEVHTNCVRVLYAKGYHVDLPVYRINDDDSYELASGATWRESRAADVENWFNEKNQSLSPDENNGRQFRRMVRMLKKFAKSRPSWKGRITSGFVITKLAAEEYCADANREDVALRDTMSAIHARLTDDLRVYHPVNTTEELTTGADDARTAHLRDRLEEALGNLEILDNPECTEEQARKAWDKVFNTDFFSSRPSGGKKSSSGANAALVQSLVANSANPKAVKKESGGRFG